MLAGVFVVNRPATTVQLSHAPVGFAQSRPPMGVNFTANSDLVEVRNAPYANAVSPEGDRFAVVDGPVVKVINRNSRGTEMALATEWPPYFRPSFSPDGNLLDWGTAEGLVIVADLAEVRNRMEQLQRSKLAVNSHRR